MAGAAELVNIEELHANSKIQKVQLSELRIDQSYQRDPSMKLVEDIAENWDEVASELLLVSNRGERPEGGEVEGGLFIVNGQHRSLGARKRGLTSVHARVIDLTEHPDPAAVEATFRLRTNIRLGDKPLERFKAQLRAGDPESVAIVGLLRQFGSFINESPNDEGINAVTAVEKLYRLNDGGVLRETLQLIHDIYGHVGGKTTSGPIMTSFAWFIMKHADETDRTRVVEKVKLAGHGALDRRARASQSTMGGTLWMNYYRAIVDFYNERLQAKSQLEWKLRGASSFKGGTGKWGKGSE
jgi:hypothetical protein